MQTRVYHYSRQRKEASICAHMKTFQLPVANQTIRRSLLSLFVVALKHSEKHTFVFLACELLLQFETMSAATLICNTSHVYDLCIHKLMYIYRRLQQVAKCLSRHLPNFSNQLHWCCECMRMWPHLSPSLSLFLSLAFSPSFLLSLSRSWYMTYLLQRYEPRALTICGNTPALWGVVPE